MMKKIHSKLFLSATSLLLFGCVSVSLPGVEPLVAHDVFNDSVSSLKTRSGYQDPSDPSGKKGLLLYGYEDGASANFGCAYNGLFKATLKPVKNDFGSIDLKEFSLLFTEKNSKQQFAIKVFVYSNYYYASVCYKGQVAGINYYDTEWSTGSQHGYTGIANKEGRYTKLSSNDNIELYFDPSTMVVQAKASDGVVRDVWDFKKEYNDGKRLANNLRPFDDYDISVVFDKVNANGCADLLAYSFAGYDLSLGSLSSITPIINTHIKAKAIVGEKYNIPKPGIASPIYGNLSSDDVSINVFDSYGESVSLTNNSFTPSYEGHYYAYYSYSKNGISASSYAKIDTINKADSYLEFSEPYFDMVVGAGKKITVPSVSLTTNLGQKATSFDCGVTISKDGQIIEGFENVETGNEFTFDTKGTYTFTYSCDGFSSEISKTVVADGRLAINEPDGEIINAVGKEFVLPNIEFAKGGREVGKRAKVYAPNGEEMKLPFVVREEGYYSISYDIDSEANPYVKKVVAKKESSSLFSGVDSSYCMSGTNNTIEGVCLSLKNNEIATYNKIINLNRFGFDNSLPDLSQNQEFLKLYIQPKTQGVNDLDSLFITLTDVDDETNYITIRAKYLSYFTSGAFMRTRANGQSSFAGYYYDFSSTARSVHNAMSHEEGGFINYLNFTSTCNGNDYADHGLPLYFDNDAGRLYSRPAWLTGHSVTKGDGFDERQVPWLVYDYKTDDPNMNAGNTPWKGFESGKVKLGIYAKGVSGTADIILTSINGESLANEYIDDSDLPTIEINKDDFVFDEFTSTYKAPQAKVGTQYKVFDFDATDETSKVFQKEVTVYGPDGKTVNLADGYFTPSQIGEYRIVYKAVDVFENQTTEEVVVTASSAVSPLSLSLDALLPESVSYGQELVLPSATYSGGSGNLRLSVSVESNTGASVPVNSMRVRVLVPGTAYTVKYTVTDYLGETKTISQNIAVNVSDKTIFDEDSLVLPSAFVHKGKYKFASLVGTHYDSDYKGTAVPAKITVTDASGTKAISGDLTYIPTWSESVSTAIVKIEFGNGSSNVSYQYEIPIIKPKTNSSSYISSYFLRDGCTVNENSQGLTFAPSEDGDMSFEFARPIDATDLLIDMSLNKDKMEFSSFEVVLKDMYNATNRVRLVYTYHYDQKTETNKLFCKLNGKGEEHVVNTGIDNVVRISYNQNTHQLIDATDSVIMTIDEYEDGSEFKGFSSNNIYYSFFAHDASASGFEISVIRINNQGTNITRNDYQDPDIIVNGRIVSRVPNGTTVSLPSATCYDVLNDVGDLTVSVKKEDGTFILEPVAPDKEMNVTFTECGTYIVTYTVSDSNGNVAERVYVITVYDDVKPELRFESEIPGTVNVGSTLTLPKYTIIDNDDPSTVTVNAYVFGPDGSMKDIKDNTVRFTMKGTYHITYIATDKNGNVASYRFTVVAK